MPSSRTVRLAPLSYLLIGLITIACSQSNESTEDTERFSVDNDAAVQRADGSMNEMDAEVEPPAPPPPPVPAYLGGDRPAMYALPYGFEPGQEMPLLISLHGFTGTAAWHDLYWGLSDLTRELGIMLLMPNGRRNLQGAQFWSATDACCNFGGAPDDDDLYLRGLIEEAQIHFNIDPKRIAVLGHSNGGFMSYRMACDHADLITHIGPLAGSSFSAEGRCNPVRPVSVFNVHGTWDFTIRYGGRATDIIAPSQRPQCETDACPEQTDACAADEDCQVLDACLQVCSPDDEGEPCRNACFGSAPEGIGELWTEYFACSLNAGCYDSSPLYLGPYPSAEENIAWWAEHNGCSSSQAYESLNFDRAQPGQETVITGYTDCNEGTDVRLGRIERGLHSPTLTPSFSTTLIEWILDTPRDE